MKNGARSWTRFTRIVSAPIRALGKARDAYVRALSNYANSGACAHMGYPALPRSFSATSSRSNGEDDLRELIKAVSARNFGDRVDLESIFGRRDSGPWSGRVVRKPAGLRSKVLPRSFTVGMGRIDEDTPCEFGPDGSGRVEPDRTYPRSRSCAVSSGGGGYVA